MSLQNVQEIILIYKGDKERLKEAETELREFFVCIKDKIVIVHSSSVERWWRSKRI